MKPDEAKTKWCPFVRFTGAGSHPSDQEWATNRGDGFSQRAFSCLAEGCMAWRWTHGHYPEGYCGLAGRE